MRASSSKDTVVVTGGNSGIGFALVQALLAQGYSVIACDVMTCNLNAIDNANLFTFRVDVREPDRLGRILDESPPGLEVVGLVACAAVFKRVPFLDLTEALWDETFEVNVTGSLHAVQAVLPHMLRAGRGSIVLLSSSLARSGSPTGGHYAATKGAILGLGRSLALEVASRNIRVNMLSPGLTDTPQPRAHPGGFAAMAERARSIPLGRIGHVDDMVAAALFLLSEDSSYVTGQDLRINGGSQLF